MSFGGKNPPWQRNNLTNPQQQGLGIPNSNLVGFQPNPAIFNQNLGMSQQQQQQQQQSSNLSLISQLSGAQIQPNQIFTQSVSYPTPRSLNSIAFGQGNNMPQPQHQQQMSQMNQSNNNQGGQSKFNPNQRVFSGTGMVTKIQNDYGFIDDEVFFHKNVCLKGSAPKVGDRVLVEAAYNQNMAFKWNATRVQVLLSNVNDNHGSRNLGNGIQQQQPQHNMSNSNNSKNSSSYNAVPPPSDRNDSHDNFSRNQSSRSRNYSPTIKKSPDRSSRSIRDSRNKDNDLDDIERRRRRDEREKERDRFRDKRDHSIDRKERSPIRKSSPKRRRTRVVPRYMVQIPKISLTKSSGNVVELRKRYGNLYIPSDFFNTQIKWMDAFPPNIPFSIQKACSFHIMHKDVEPIYENDAVLDPPDADYLYSAKVMLMSSPSIAEIYQKCFATAEEKERGEDDRDFIHPTRLISFLVGMRAKNETMAIGGPWSPSLDGEDPASNPSVLIKTATRNCKALTGIDLSNCTHWYRFVELYYRRSEISHKGRLVPARIETVVIFLPDVRACTPTRLEWDTLHIKYKNSLDCILNQNTRQSVELNTKRSSSSLSANVVVAGKDADNDVDAPAESGGDDSVSNRADSLSSPLISTCNNVVAEDSNIDGDGEGDVPVVADNISAEQVAGDDEMTAAAADDGPNEIAEPIAENNKNDKNIDANVKDAITADTDLKLLKITELRSLLQEKGLSTKGLKPQLVARLAKALKSESDQPIRDEQVVVKEADEVVSEVTPMEEDILEESIETELDISEVTIIDEYDSTKCDDKYESSNSTIEVRKLDEKERQLLEKRHTLPENPHIVVHPSRIAKSGKFDCTVMSLSLLLDYRPEDTKEHSFEVSLFAELFNEMLMRDFGFNIYKALYNLPDKVDEPKKDSEDKSKDDKKKSDDKEKNPKISESDKKSEEVAGGDKKEDNAEEKKDESSAKVSTDGDKEKDKKSQTKDVKDLLKENTKDRERDRDHRDDKGRESRKRSKHGEPDDTDDDNSIKSGDRRKKDKENTKDRSKFYTAYPELLLSFVYFDQSQCGYIFEKDIEDLFYTLGLNLSRAQTRKLAVKVITRDSLYYRKLTDRPVEEEKKDLIDPVDEQSLMPDIILGNKIIQSDLMANNAASKTLKADQQQSTGDVVESKNGMVKYNGGLLDVQKLLDQLKRSDSAREETEQQLVELRKQNIDLSGNYAKANSKIKDLSSDLKSYHRKLNDVEQNLSSTNRKCSDYYSLLSNINDKLAPVFVKSEKSSSSSSRRETSRDTEKDRDRDVKDKEKEEKKEAEHDEIKKEK